MPHAVTLLSGWACLVAGLLFVLRGLRLLRAQRGLHVRSLPGERFNGGELLWEGAAFALLGIGNLLGGRWVLLAFPAMVLMLALGVVLGMRLVKGWSKTWRRPR